MRKAAFYVRCGCSTGSRYCIFLVLTCLVVGAVDKRRPRKQCFVFRFASRACRIPDLPSGNSTQHQPATLVSWPSEAVKRSQPRRRPTNRTVLFMNAYRTYSRERAGRGGNLCACALSPSIFSTVNSYHSGTCCLCFVEDNFQHYWCNN